MKQIRNGFSNCYSMDSNGNVYNTDNGKTIQAYNNRYKLRTLEGEIKSISKKRLYRMVYGKEFCIDKIETLEGEEWKEIGGTKGCYYVSNMGRIKSYNGYEAIILNPYMAKNGYKRVDIVQKEQRLSKLVHRLVAAAFLLQPTEIDMQLHHIDGNKENNAASNLLWVTAAEHVKIHRKLRENKNA